MPMAGFEPTVSVGERSHTYALDGAASRISYGTLELYEYRRTDFRVPSRAVHIGSHLQC